MFTFWGGAICWRSVKQVGVANSTMETGFIAALEAAVEVEWLSSFLMDKGLVPSVQWLSTFSTIGYYCNISRAIERKKEPSFHEIGNHIKLRNYLFER